MSGAGPIEHAIELLLQARERFGPLVDDVRLQLHAELDEAEAEAEILDAGARRNLSDDTVQAQREIDFLLDRYDADIRELLTTRLHQLEDRLDEVSR